MKTILDVKNIDFSYGRTKVLSDVSFSIQKGDFIGLVGENGSGKTTLLKLLLDLQTIQKGSITLFGTPIPKFKSWDKIGYVPQKATNISEQFPATVQEIVATGLLPLKKFPKKYAKTDHTLVDEALQEVNMLEYKQRRIGQLSGGQQQRVLIARALVTNPEFLILDEPTTGVDQKTQNSFYNLLGTLNKKGITILLVSHDLHRITHHTTKIASLHTTLDFYGTHEEFCKHPHKKEDHHCLKFT
ncbi:MAG: metal ABC transporter ATP-binding protein [Candidatus Woesearchaeota archaeon]